MYEDEIACGLKAALDNLLGTPEYQGLLRQVGDAFAQRFAREEREAWDKYVAGLLTRDCGFKWAAAEADSVLAERRVRFPALAPRADTVDFVKVPCDLLARVSNALVATTNEEESRQLAGELRTLLEALIVTW